MDLLSDAVLALRRLEHNVIGNRLMDICHGSAEESEPK